MIDNFTLEIEHRAAVNGSYVETLVEICEERNLCEYEVIDMLHPVLWAKVRQEFIDKKNIPSLINHASMESFFD
jgi:hypothetical protein